MSGIKHDEDKPRMSLLPKVALIEVAKVLTFGAKKYEPWNWTKGFAWSRLYDAAERHIAAHQMGTDKDEETKLSHLAHATCCLLFLLTFELLGLGEDDRHQFKKVKRPLDISDLSVGMSVRVISNISDHEFQEGEVITIKELLRKGFFAENSKGDEWWLTPSEMELI